MTADEAFVLNEAQLAYEYDCYNPKKAYEYFAELNKHQFYVTVVKEYDEFQERVAKDKSNADKTSQEWQNRLQSQYDYALDHLSAQAKAIDGGLSPEQEQANSDYDLKSSVVNLVNSILVLAAFYGFFVYFEPLKSSDFGNNQQG